MSYENKVFWDSRLKKHWDLQGVGHAGYSKLYNTYIYRAKIRVLEKATNKFGIQLAGKKVLDIGSGIGFWLDYYGNQGAVVTGIEISSHAVKMLKNKFPGMNVYEGDIGQEIPFPGTFDIINCFDVLYHITDDTHFSHALLQIGERLNPGGYFFLTDLFPEKGYSSAEHVYFHSLGSYKDILSKKDCSVLAVYPLYGLLNGGLMRWKKYFGPGLIGNLFGEITKRIEEISVPLLYCLDGLWIPEFMCNARLMVVHKK